MDLSPYVDSLRHDLASAAAAGGAEAQAAAERLTLALDPAIRLALMDALSQAAAEITSELPAGSVDVRLRGREPRFVVDVPAAEDVQEAPATAPPDDDADDARDADADVARITLRLPESVKTRAEELAALGGQSLNAWIVGALRTATRQRSVDGDPPGPRRSPRRMTGWV